MPNGSVVEERVVEMRIDNDKFESGARKTISILEQLDQGLQSLGKQNGDGLDNITDSLDKVTNRFSALGIVGDQVIRSLTNKAMELVSQLKNVATALTTQQIDAGWNKYADKTQAIQTIMAATSYTIDEGRFEDAAAQLEWVNEQVQKLNQFSDETSYSFLDMVGNVGKFTAAGRDLEESVKAMEGISTWAALSGGKPAEASRAMYNLSQALGMGYVGQMDWKSIENANMATYEFKQQVIDLAEEMGRLEKVEEGVWINAEGHEVTVEGFRENLKDKWFDSDVLLSVLDRYGSFADELMIATEATDTTATKFLEAMEIYEEGGEAGLEEARYTAEDIQKLLPYLEKLSGAEYELGKRAFQAAQEAKTFTEAIDATKDAVSTKWMDVFEYIFGDYLQAKELWTNLSETLWNIFAGPVDRLKEILQSATGENHAALSETGETMKRTGVTASNFIKKLNAAGYSLSDLEGAFYKVADGQTLYDLETTFGSFEEALAAGAISADQLKWAIAALADPETIKGPVSLQRALAQNKKTMKDFQNAVEKVMKDSGNYSQADISDVMRDVEQAFYDGKISAEVFQAALAALGINSEDVATEVETATQSTVHSLDEMREVALGILRGDYGNGDERRKAIEELGLDYELMQAMAGDLKNEGYYISDDKLMAMMESYYRYMDIAARLGYESFEEYVAAIMQTQEEIDVIDELLGATENILEETFGEGIYNDAGELMDAGELFRAGLTNIMNFFNDLASLFDEAFLKVFGGSDDVNEAVANLGDRFWMLAYRFNQASEAIQLVKKVINDDDEEVTDDSRYNRLLSIITGILSVIRFIGKAVSFAFRIIKAGLSLVFGLLSPLMGIIGDLFAGLGSGLDTLTNFFETSPVIQRLKEIGAIIFGSIVAGLEKLANVIHTVIDAFRNGFADGGLANGFRSVGEAITNMLQNHPVLLSIFTFLQKIAPGVGKILGFIGQALQLIAFIIGGVLVSAFNVLQQVFTTVGAAISSFLNRIMESETLKNFWANFTGGFEKFGNAISEGVKAAKASLTEGGFSGAISTFFKSFKDNLSELNIDTSNLQGIFKKVSSSVSTFFSNAGETVSGFKIDTVKMEERFNKLSSFFSNLYIGIFGTEEERDEVKQKISNFITTAWEGLLEGLSKIKLSDVIGALRLSVIASVAAEVMSVITIFKKAAEGIKDIPTQLAESVTRFVKSLAIDISANVVMKIAASILMLAIAFLLLSKVPQDRLAEVAAVVIAVLGVIFLIVKGLSKMQMLSNNWIRNIQVFPELGSMLLGLAAALIAFGMVMTALTLLNKFAGAENVNAAVNTILKFVALVGGLMIGLVLLNTFMNKNNITNFGTGFLEFGAVILMISLALQGLVIPIIAITLLSKYFPKEAGGAIRKIIALILTVVISMGALVWLTATMNSEELRSAALLILAIGGAMVLLASAVSILVGSIIAITVIGTLLKNNMTSGFMIMIMTLLIFFVGFGVLMGVLLHSLASMEPDKIKEIGNTALKLAASLVIVAVGISMIIGSMLLIAAATKAFGSGSTIMAIGAIVVMLVALVVALSMLSKLDADGGQLMMMAGAIAILALALNLMVPAILALVVATIALAPAISKMENFWTVLGKLALLSVVLLVFAAAGLVFAAALTIIGAAILIAGIGILALSAGLWLFVKVADKFSSVGPKFAKAFNETMEEISFKSILKFIAVVAFLAAAFILLWAGLSKLADATGIADSIESTFDKIVKVVEKAGLALVKGVMNMLKTIGSKAGNYIKNNKTSIIQLITNGIILAGAILSGIIPTLARTIITGIIDLLNAVATSIEENSTEFADAINRILAALIGLAGDLLQPHFDGTFLDSLDTPFKRILYWLLIISAVISGLKLVAPFLGLSGVLTGGAGAAAGGGLLASLGSMFGWLIAIAAVIGACVIGYQKMKDAEEAYQNERIKRRYGETLEDIDPDDLAAGMDEYADELKEADDNVVQLGESLKETPIEETTPEMLENFDDAVTTANDMATDLVVDFWNLKEKLAEEYDLPVKAVSSIADALYNQYGSYTDALNGVRAFLDEHPEDTENEIENFLALLKKYKKNNYDDWLTLKDYVDAGDEEAAKKFASSMGYADYDWDIVLQTLEDRINEYNTIKGELDRLQGLLLSEPDGVSGIEPTEKQQKQDELAKEYDEYIKTAGDLERIRHYFRNQLYKTNTEENPLAGFEDLVGLSAHDVFELMGTLYTEAEEHLEKAKALRAEIDELVNEPVLTEKQQKQDELAKEYDEYIKTAGNLERIRHYFRNQLYKTNTEENPLAGFEDLVGLSAHDVFELMGTLYAEAEEHLEKAKALRAEIDELAGEPSVSDISDEAPVEETEEPEIQATAEIEEVSIDPSVEPVEVEVVPVVEPDNMEIDGEASGNTMRELYEALGLDTSTMEDTISGAWSGIPDDMQSTINGFNLSDLFGGEAINTDEIMSMFNGVLSGINLDQKTSINLLDFTDADGVVDQEALREAMVEAGYMGATGLGEGFSDNSEVVEAGATDAANAAITGAEETLEENSPSRVFYRIGENAIIGMQEGIASSKGLAVDAVISITQSMIASVGNLYGHFYNYGVNAGIGLVNGVSAENMAAYTAGANLAASLENGFTDELGIESPSRVFMNLARFIPLGIAAGIQASEGEAVNSLTILSDALIDAIDRSMAEVGLMADDEFGLSPTITPVVDLSNVNAASGMVDGAFDSSYSVSAAMNGSINRRLSEIENLAASMGSQQTINNGDVITFNIYASEGMDENAIADAVLNKMANRMGRRVAAFG